MDEIKDIEIQNQILQILYDNRQVGFMLGRRIHEQLPPHIQEVVPRKQIDFHLRTLKERKLIRDKRETHKIASVYKSSSTKNIAGSDTLYRYEISDLGVTYVESDFKNEKSTNSQKPTAIFIGGNFNFGVINNTINYNIELTNLIDDSQLRAEIKSYFDQLKDELNNDTISKYRIVDLLKKIGAKISDKGLDKVMDLAYTVIGSFFKQFL